LKKETGYVFVIIQQFLAKTLNFFAGAFYFQLCIYTCSKSIRYFRKLCV